MGKNRQQPRRATPIVAPQAKAKGFHWLFNKNLLRALVVWVLLAGVDYVMRDCAVNSWLTQQAYSFLQSNLPLDRQPRSVVTVVDLSKWTTTNDLRSVPAVPGLFIRTGWPYTERLALEALVKKLAMFEPAAIGIDIDFSPVAQGQGGDGRPPPNQIPFFDICKSLETPTGQPIPVYLGVARTINLPPAGWLNSVDHIALAAGIVKFSGTSSHIPFEIRLRTDSPPLPCMAKALSDAYLKKTGSEPNLPPGWLLPFLQGQKRELLGNGSEGRWVSSFPVDYFTTMPVIENNRIPGGKFLNPTPDEFSELQTRIYNHVVLVGYATRSEAYDTVTVPGEPEPVPGVYTHACGTATLLEKPLFEINEVTGLGLSLLASIFAYALVQWLKPKEIWRHWGLAALETIVMIFGVLTSGLMAVLLARYEQILWLQITVFWLFMLVEFLLNNATARHDPDLYLQNVRKAGSN